MYVYIEFSYNQDLNVCYILNLAIIKILMYYILNLAII